MRGGPRFYVVSGSGVRGFTSQALVLDRAFCHRVVYRPSTGRKSLAVSECERLNRDVTPVPLGPVRLEGTMLVDGVFNDE